MISPADRSRRPRRFFGLRGVVRRLRRPEAGDAVRPRRQPSDRRRPRAAVGARALRGRPGPRAPARVPERSGDAARARLRGARVRARPGVPPARVRSAERLRARAPRRVGADAAERRLAGDAPRRAAGRLDAPTTARSSRGPRRARSARWPSPRTRNEWLAVARRSTVDTLERLVARARHPDGVPADPEGDPNEIDGEPAVRWRFVCPARVRALWRRALELASRVAGEPLADWRAAEIVAAEGSSGAAARHVDGRPRVAGGAAAGAPRSPARGRRSTMSRTPRRRRARRASTTGAATIADAVATATVAVDAPRRHARARRRRRPPHAAPPTRRPHPPTPSPSTRAWPKPCASSGPSSRASAGCCASWSITASIDRSAIRPSTTTSASASASRSGRPGRSSRSRRRPSAAPTSTAPTATAASRGSARSRCCRCSTVRPRRHGSRGRSP